MKNILILLNLLTVLTLAKAQTGYSCADAIPIVNIKNACSDSAKYTNTNPAQNGVTWFKFTADSNSIHISINGLHAGGSLQRPVIKMYYGCKGIEYPGNMNLIQDVSTFFATGLVPGNTLYFAVSSQNGKNGSFSLCINSSDIENTNFYCSKAMFLCNTNDYTFYNTPASYLKVIGHAGNALDNIKNTCLRSVANTTLWFKWQAKNAGQLVFTITSAHRPAFQTFILYDLGTSDDCSNAFEPHVVRCMGWSPLACNGIQSNPVGLSFAENDVTESSACGKGQNGRLQYLTMVPGHFYALGVAQVLGYLNTDTYNAGFTLSFKDEHNIPGTATFTPPDPEIAYQSADQGCSADRTYLFHHTLSTYSQLDWDFADGTVVNADAGGNLTVNYATTGIKKVTLIAGNEDGCSATGITSFTIDNGPAINKPTISINKPTFCLSDTLILSTPQVIGLTYKWTGPGNFNSTNNKVLIPITDAAQAGTYKLVAYQDKCPSVAATVAVPAFLGKVTAAFSTEPAFPATLTNPATVQFTNQSVNADRYIWDFGDGSTSTLKTPSHQYLTNGIYKVKLTVFQSTACSNAVIKGDLIVKKDESVFIPNTFTPNGDGINDEFGIGVNSVQSYYLQVFNRYGQLLFESKTTGNKWNGTYQNKAVPIGTYYYIIAIVSESGTPMSKSGSVTLIR